MTDTNKTLAEINKTFEEFMLTLSSFYDEQINKIPFEGSWTPGQVTQHIIMSVSGFVELMGGPDEETIRQPDAYVGNIREAFLNFNIKMQSPDFIIPPAKNYNKAELLLTLDQLKNQLNQLIPVKDMTKTCTAFELPVLGYLTRTELANFIEVHTKRHLHQLKNIYNKINHSN
jgi:hypothetical protein